jgi:UDP-N-acetylglucosamine/UDP-N-acetylgalactosamine diphosphorylase
LAGAPVTTDSTGLPQFNLEISPLFGYDDDSFMESWNRLQPKPTVSDGSYIS